MPRPKKSTTATIVATARPSTSTATSGASAESVNKFYGETNGRKHKGKAPSEKTKIVRAGIAEYPKLLPKALADLLNKSHPGYKFTNQDVSQQKLQLRNLRKKPGRKKTKQPTVEIVPTPGVKVAASVSDIKHLAVLAKKMGTNKVREICDLIDYVTV